MRPDYDSVYKMRELRGYYNCDKDNIFVLFVPRRTRECDKLLKDADFLNEQNIHQMDMDLVALEEDLLSLELPDNFAHHMLQDDDEYKVYVQYSITKLEAIYG